MQQLIFLVLQLLNQQEEKVEIGDILVLIHKLLYNLALVPLVLMVQIIVEQVEMVHKQEHYHNQLGLVEQVELEVQV